MPRKVRKFQPACTRGSTAAEFALIAPFLLAMLFGLIEVSRFFWTLTTVQYAVDEAGRWAMVNTSATTTQIRDKALAKLTNLPIAAADVQVTPEVAGGVNFVAITCCTNYQFESVIDMEVLDLGTIAINVRSRVPLIP